jgi:hypothetical protein
MKVKRVLFLCSVAALPQLAMALTDVGERPEVKAPEHPAATSTKPANNHAAPTSKSAGTTQSSTSPQALGMVHAILDFCAQVDPHDAAAFQTIWTSMSGSGAGQLTGNSAFQQGYALVTSELAQTSKSAAAKTCAASVENVASSSSGENEHPTTGFERRPH